MNVETAVNEIISLIDSPAARLQTLFKRKQQQDAIIPELIVKQDEERKQDAINTLSDVFKREKKQDGIIPESKAKQEQKAFDTLRGVFKRSKIQPKCLRVVNKSKQQALEQQNVINTLSDVFKRKQQQEGIIPELKKLNKNKKHLIP
jgi:hypothetical protein